MRRAACSRTASDTGEARRSGRARARARISVSRRRWPSASWLPTQRGAVAAAVAGAGHRSSRCRRAGRRAGRSASSCGSRSRPGCPARRRGRSATRRGCGGCGSGRRRGATRSSSGANAALIGGSSSSRVRVAEVEQAVRAVVDADQRERRPPPTRAPRRGAATPVGRDRGVEHRHLPAAARELLGREPRDGRAAAAVVAAERRHQQRGARRRGRAARASAAGGRGRGRRSRRALAQPARPARGSGSSRRSSASASAAAAPGARAPPGSSTRPVELGHELAQRVPLERGFERALDVVDLPRAGRLVGGVLAVAAHRRSAGRRAQWRNRNRRAARSQKSKSLAIG